MFGLENRVSEGATLLDEKYPGWHWNISLNRLNMKQCQTCILGQLYDDYHIGLVSVGVNWYEAFRRGFNLPEREWWNTWGALRRLWIKEILSRRKLNNSNAH